MLRGEDFEVKLDVRNEKLGKKIKDAQKLKIPYMAIIGKREKDDYTVNIRTLDGTQKTDHWEMLAHEMSGKIILKT